VVWIQHIANRGEEKGGKGTTSFPRTRKKRGKKGRFRFFQFGEKKRKKKGGGEILWAEGTKRWANSRALLLSQVGKGRGGEGGTGAPGTDQREGKKGSEMQSVSF